MKKFLSLLFAIIMVVGMFPMNAIATEIQNSGDNNTPVVTSEGIYLEMRLNDWEDINLSEYFSDAEGENLTYYVSIDGEEWEIASENYAYYPAGDGEQKAYFKAVDENGNESEILTLTANVEVAPNVVTVKLSVTDGETIFYTSEESGTIMVPTELTVPYFDLALYGAEEYYYNPRCYSTHKEGDTEYENGQLAGTKDTAEGIVTLMHVFIYATEVLYMGYDTSDAGTGASFKTGDFSEIVSWTGGVGSSYMSLWDHGTNLNYYVDWEYPVGAYKWGSTSDQIALYGGEDVSIHMIENGTASGSDFVFFTVNGEYDAKYQVEEAVVNKGEQFVVTAVKTSPAYETFTTEYEPYSGKAVYYIKEDDLSGNITEWKNFGINTDNQGDFVIDTSSFDEGTYYFAVKGSYNSDSGTETGAGIIKITIVCDHDWKEATCTEPKTCILCGSTIGNELGHKWTAATCKDPKTCSNCGQTVGEKDPEAHVYKNGVCELCGEADPGNTSFEAAPTLIGTSSISLLEKQNELYELDLSAVFNQAAWYTVSIDGKEAVSTSKKFSYSCETPGTHKLVFKAGNNKGDSPAYTVTLTVIDSDAIQKVNYSVIGGTIEWFAFTDDKMNPLPEDTKYEWNAETNKFTVIQPANVNLTGKVVVYYKLTKDNAGAKLPLLTGSTAITGAGTKWDGGVRDRQTITLSNGEAEGCVYLYETTPTAANNIFKTITFELKRNKPATYFEYKTTGYATYTIAGETGGVNGHTWITSDEVHIALKDSTPSDAKLTFLEQKAETTLVDGAGTYTWGNKTIKYKIDNIPSLAEGQETTIVESVPAKSAYTIDLANLFEDKDESDTLSYRVKINNGNMKKVSGSTYSYTPANAGTYTLTFYAYDGFVYSEDCYTVTLTAVNLADTYNVTVNNLPEGAEFYYNNGFNSDGMDILGGKLEASYANGVYTVKVPANITCIAIAIDDCRMTAEVSETKNSITMQKTTFEVNTKAGDKAEGTVTVTYGGGHKAIGKNNVYWLVSGSGYLFEAKPSENFSDRWSSGGKSGTVTTEQEATVIVELEVNSPKSITVDKGAEVTVFYQWGYYRMYVVEPALIKDNGDDTITYTYPCPDTQAYAKGYMYFATNGDMIDKAGYMNSVTNTTVTWEGETRKNDHVGTNTRYTYMNERTDDSVMVNINSQNHLILEPGETFRLRAFRIWEIINTDTENVMIEPQFIYSGYDENIISMISANETLAAEGKIQVNGTGGNNWMDMTANSAGLTFMEVSYEAIHVVDGFEAGDWGGAGGQPSDYLFNACDPARTALIVIQTDGNAATDVDFGIECLSSYVGEENFYTGTGLKNWDVEFDTLYFLGDFGEMKLSPKASSGSVKSVEVSNDKGETWKTLTAKDGVYTAEIYSGNNIIRVTKDDGTTAYQVVRGDKITYTQTITNDLNKNGEVDPGDTVHLKFHGLHNPVGKMSGIYNPGFSHGQRVAYTWNGEQVRQSSYHQYSFVKNAEISVTVPADATGRFALTEGYIHFNVFGDMPGTHRDLTDGGRPVNTTAESGKHTRSLLPDIVIYDDGTEENVLLGDMDGNGTINVTDVNMLINAYRGKTYIEEGDMNSDGKIDVTDVNLLINAYRNKA